MMLVVAAVVVGSGGSPSTCPASCPLWQPRRGSTAISEAWGCGDQGTEVAWSLWFLHEATAARLLLAAVSESGGPVQPQPPSWGLSACHCPIWAPSSCSGKGAVGWWPSESGGPTSSARFRGLVWMRTFLLRLGVPGLVGSAVGPSVVEFTESCVCQLTPRVARP